MELLQKIYKKGYITISFQIYSSSFFGVGIEIESFNDIKENGIHLVLPFLNISLVWFQNENSISNGNSVMVLVTHIADDHNIAPIGKIGTAYDCDAFGCMVEFKTNDSITSLYYYYNELRKI